MINKCCENCKYSSWFGSPLWCNRKLLCEKGYNTSVINHDRYFSKKECKDYILDIDKIKNK